VCAFVGHIITIKKITPHHFPGDAEQVSKILVSKLTLVHLIAEESFNAKVVRFQQMVNNYFLVKIRASKSCVCLTLHFISKYVSYLNIKDLR
jgi:hypothetical protein